MRNRGWATILIRIMLLLAVLAASGCAFILGKEEAPAQRGLPIRFVEMLRNETSLRGESLRESPPRTADRLVSLQQPNSVYADAFRVYVTDFSPARVFVFDRGERKVTVLDGGPSPAMEGTRLVSPSAIAVDAANTVWVSDSAQGKVFGYDRYGKLLFTVGKTAEAGQPSGLASDHRRNRLYVADASAQVVKVFDSLGTRSFEIGGAGKPEEKLKFPGALTLDQSGNLYVLDTLLRRVHIYDPDGKFVRAINLSGALPGQAVKPKGIALDSQGHLYVSDMVSNNVLVFDAEGALLLTWGRTGSLIGEFWTPAGIFIDEQDFIYIADQTNGRVQVFQYSRQ